MAKKITDSFANKIAIEITTSAADTTTYQQIITGVPLYERMGMVIGMVEYQASQVFAGLWVADGDYGLACLAIEASPETGIGSPQIIDQAEWTKVGAVATFGWTPDQMHVRHDFTGLPGGGILLPAVPIYAIWTTGSLGAVAAVGIRVWYTYRSMSAEDYYDLVEAVRGVLS